MEVLRLRVKDLDFGMRQITVRDGTGFKDRVTMLPESLIEPLQRYLQKVKEIHQGDLRAGFGAVYLPYALERKYPNAGREWGWQYVFPSSQRSIDRYSGKERRHQCAAAMRPGGSRTTRLTHEKLHKRWRNKAFRGLPAGAGLKPP